MLVIFVVAEEGEEHCSAEAGGCSHESDGDHDATSAEITRRVSLRGWSDLC